MVLDTTFDNSFFAGSNICAIIFHVEQRDLSPPRIPQTNPAVLATYDPSTGHKFPISTSRINQ